MIKEKKWYAKPCPICNKYFYTQNRMKIICSGACRERSRRQVKIMKDSLPHAPCQICGFNFVVDVHHEGTKTYWLCPNHHAMITRGFCTINELNLYILSPKVLKMGLKRTKIGKTRKTRKAIRKTQLVISQ